MNRYRITVWGWLPENQYSYGGTPEYAETVWIEAPSAAIATRDARLCFEDRHEDCSHVEAQEGRI